MNNSSKHRHWKTKTVENINTQRRRQWKTLTLTFDYEKANKILTPCFGKSFVYLYIAYTCGQMINRKSENLHFWFDYRSIYIEDLTFSHVIE